MLITFRKYQHLDSCLIKSQVSSLAKLILKTKHQRRQEHFKQFPFWGSFISSILQIRKLRIREIVIYLRSVRK